MQNKNEINCIELNTKIFVFYKKNYKTIILRQVFFVVII